MRLGILALVVITLGSACTHSHQPVSVRASGVNSPTGDVAIVFTRPTKGVTIALDGQLLVSRKHTDYVLIEGVTAGITELRIAAGSGPSRLERDLRIDVEVGRITTVPLGAPEPEQSSGLVNAALSIAAIVLSTAVTNWLF